MYKIEHVVALLDQNFETDHPDLRRPQPPHLGCYVRHHHLLAVPWSAQLWLAQDVCQHGTLPSPALLHPGLRAAHVSWVAAIPRHHRTGAHATDVWRQEHDGGLRPASRTVSHSRLYVPVRSQAHCIHWNDLLCLGKMTHLRRKGMIRIIYWAVHRQE